MAGKDCASRAKAVQKGKTGTSPSKVMSTVNAAAKKAGHGKQTTSMPKSIITSAAKPATKGLKSAKKAMK